MYDIRRIKPTDDLELICSQMQPNNWAADNEMTSYQPEHLRRFLDDENNILVLAYDDDKIAGALLGFVLAHPDGNDTLYVHELDTHPDFRRHGIAKMLMNRANKIARAKNLDEVWLGADQDNPGANEFYKTLNPSEIEPTITYTYKVEK